MNVHKCRDGWQSAYSGEDIYCQLCGERLLYPRLSPPEILFISSQGHWQLTQSEIVIDNSRSVKELRAELVSSHPAIALGPENTTKAEVHLPAGEQQKLVVQFHGGNEADFSSEALIQLVLLPTAGVLAETMVKFGQEPVFGVTPPQLQSVAPGETTRAQISIQQTSGVRTKLTGIELSPEASFSLVGLEEGRSFETGSHVSFALQFTAPTNARPGTIEGLLELRFDIGKPLRIPFTARISEPSGLNIDIAGNNQVPAGILSDLTLTYRVQGSQSVQIYDIKIAGAAEWFSVKLPSLPLTLSPNDEPLRIPCLLDTPEHLESQDVRFTCTVESSAGPAVSRTFRLKIEPARFYEHFVGIDFGTTNSCVAYWDEDQEIQMVPFTHYRNGEPATKTVPSLAFYDSASNQWLAGYDAIARAEQIKSQEHLVRSVKRLLNQDRWSGKAKVELSDGSSVEPEVVAAAVIRYLRRQTERHLGCKLGEVILTLPANFTDAGVQAVIKAASMAGVNTFAARNAENWKDCLLDEPTAAAIDATYASNQHRDPAAPPLPGDDVAEKLVLIFDFGGGTLDVCLLLLIQRPDLRQIQVLAYKGANWLGGDDFTRRMLALLADRFSRDSGVSLRYDPEQLQQEKTWRSLDSAQKSDVHVNYRYLWEAAEDAKIALSKKENVDVEAILKMEGQKRKFAVTVSREEYERTIERSVEDAIAIVDRTFKAASRIRPVEISSINEVIATGKASLVPLVRKRLEEHLKCKLTIPQGFDEKECVSRGSCRYAMEISTARAEGESSLSVKRLDDRTNCSYGIERNESSSSVISRKIFEPLIPEGAKLSQNNKSVRIISTGRWPETTIAILQHTGDLEEPGANLIENNRDITRIDQIKVKARNKKTEVSMWLGEDGMVEAEAKVTDTGEVFHMENHYRSDNGDDSARRG
ncbi:MAG TPA: Hsp70 family protein [Candidatus Angelobacter sp.]|nr:Hsp70 family protein [Candidatus Angelobacter sp.]